MGLASLYSGVSTVCSRTSLKKFTKQEKTGSSEVGEVCTVVKDLEKKKKKKRVAYESSSESEPESDSESDTDTSEEEPPSREYEGRQISRRSRSPPIPKMQEFHGEPVKWISFKFQFEQAAQSFRWDERTKLDRLVACLRDKAVEFVQRRPKSTLKDYKKLMKELQRRYGQKDPPSTSRRQLSYVKQEENEDLDDYAERVHQLVIDGFPGVDKVNIQILAMDAFLKGCNNKFAALVASGTKLRSLQHAVRKVKGSIHDQKSIGKPQYQVRQVNFDESSTLASPPTSPSGKKMSTGQASELAEIVTVAVKTALASLMKPAPGGLPEANRNPGSPRGCFICRAEGHFARDCPRRTNLPSSPSRGTSPNRPITCDFCDQEGHFLNTCPKKQAPHMPEKIIRGIIPQIDHGKVQ